MIDFGISVPVYNEEKNILPLLSSIASQKYPKKEILVSVADNKSTDSTVDRIKEFGQRPNSPEIYLTNQPVRGIGPTRKAALDLSLKSGAVNLLSLDADCILPTALLALTKKIVQISSPLSVLTYNLVYPKRFQLALFAHYKPLMRLMKRLAKFQESVLGPVAYTGCLMIPSLLYSKLYWEDAANPLIPDDDYLISRRLFALGATFSATGIDVPTSDRRFWASPKSWAEHKHLGIYRKDVRVENRIDLPAITGRTFESRIKKAAERVLQSVTEYVFLSRIPETPYERSEYLVKKAISRLELTEFFCPGKQELRRSYYTKLKDKYFKGVYDKLHNYSLPGRHNVNE